MPTAQQNAGVLLGAPNGVAWGAGNISVGSGGQVVVGTAHQAIAVSFDYNLAKPCSPAGAKCKLQLELGTDLGGLSSCAFAGSVTSMDTLVGPVASAMGHYSGTVPLGGSGVYKIKLNGASNSACASSWTSGEPGDFAIIGYVCVP